MNVENEIEILDVCLTHPKLHVHKKLLVKLTQGPQNDSRGHKNSVE
jgi:hypothetical protein